MPTQEYRPVDDPFKIKTPPGPPPGGGRKRGAGGWLAGVLLLALVAGGLVLWRVFLHPAPTPVSSRAASRTATPTATPKPTPAAPAAPTPPAIAASTPTAAATSTSTSAPTQPAPLEPGPLLLRIHGSNTIGEKLMPELVKAFMASERYTHLQTEPSDKPTLSYVVGQRSNGVGRVEILAAGSETGFKDLAAGSADIGMSSETISPAQASTLKESLGDVSSRAGEHVIGVDGVTVIVHTLNRVSDLSVRQVANIFSGAIQDWSEVGGAPGRIQLYMRGEESGTRAIFTQDVLQAKSLSPKASVLTRSSDLSDAVAGDTQGIGVIGVAYVSSNKILGLSEPGVAPRRPALCTLKTEEYLLTRRLYLYTATNPQPEVAHFIQFATSKDAWPIVQEAGFVNLDPRPVAACNSSAQAQHTPEYVKATQGAQRLLTNFHFRPKSFELDNKAELSLGYLAQGLASGAYPGHRLLLIGYADDGVSAEDSKRRSLREANAVRQELDRLLKLDAINMQIDPPKGLGAQELLAPHDTAAGHEKNRRVEIWLR